MKTIKNFIISIIFFTIGLLIIISIDYSIRIVNEINYGLGFNETIWFLTHILVSAIALFIFFKRENSTKIVKKILLMAVLSVFGFGIYILTVGYYVISSGVDSL